ncbi:putative capsular polysaccharide synthesis family protein [uncultured Polaribacter sp.]|uniref:putative capsular polysaccharide synthesis family protein n=1 Tax=uncultured Polaribacter sp. TaxID=174711 RepID=UPI002632AB56|nr:putative capsular polysaccharide synthesis family protein [uncultured Polaribacter sp.]
MQESIDPLRKELNLIQKIKTWFGSNSVIVLTMGKVGTLTICNSLEKIDINHVHPHSLIHSYPGTHFLKNVKLPFSKHIYYTYKTITKRIKIKIWKLLSSEIVIVTGIRDPFSRYISAFFEQAHYLNYDTNKNDIEDVIKKLDYHGDFNSTFNWFDKEINKVFGIDVFKFNFDKEKGYSVITKGKVKLFIYRLDKLNDLEAELKDFIGSEKFKLISHNILDNNLNYLKLKDAYKFKKIEINEVVKSEFMKHFYKKDELNNLLDKWTN